jgi:hypothetical protein
MRTVSDVLQGTLSGVGREEPSALGSVTKAALLEAIRLGLLLRG